ncbi:MULTISPECIES: helix-turn-helix transcriptional regulator [unclassified Bacillus (in: firmicutes)]|uniref:helix-turn-helix transcriptional regulator n=1 Tax=unclassified Bacillus (in: firmicutes) TaxID=185979 RepID=UPI001BE712E2|nr:MULTISPECIES: helix-turn-helix transcriptional regulator [unclassified Bacillus (in: firmicutes)]MBT2617251.1 helix-turn-helix transcriptional regulator [Bacillus sp. ISL-78]MBT2627814.1 helix-turn-helix transcriptional regulator [Bacillus sp. ISL-101]
MVSLYTIQNHIQKIEKAESHEEKMYQILQIYVELFPVSNATLSRYSTLGYLGEGIISLSSNELVYISEMRDDIRSLPIIESSIRERKAKFCTGIDCLKLTSSKYIIASNVHSIIVVPICNGTTVIGFICSTQFLEGTHFGEALLSSFTHYGKLIGKFLEESDLPRPSMGLTKRELEVMRRISWGERAKEMAISMEISELTINQYVKSSIKKLGAQNRAHAVGLLLRKGILS